MVGRCHREGDNSVVSGREKQRQAPDELSDTGHGQVEHRVTMYASTGTRLLPTRPNDSPAIGPYLDSAGCVIHADKT